MRTQTWLTLAIGLFAIVWGGCAGGCGFDAAVDAPATAGMGSMLVEASSSTTPDAETRADDSPGSGTPSPTSTPSSSTQVKADGARSEIARLFTELARELDPLPVYGLTELPPSASIPKYWWPAVTSASPPSDDSRAAPNPWVSDSPPGTQEAQVLLQWRDGWIMILENFRGDVGDVESVSVGQVGGRPASLFEFPGGALVQWSDAGAWYGVLGRGVRSQEIVETAHLLRVISPRD